MNEWRKVKRRKQGPPPEQRTRWNLRVIHSATYRVGLSGPLRRGVRGRRRLGQKRGQGLERQRLMLDAHFSHTR